MVTTCCTVLWRARMPILVLVIININMSMASRTSRLSPSLAPFAVGTSSIRSITQGIGCIAEFGTIVDLRAAFCAPSNIGFADFFAKNLKNDRPPCLTIKTKHGGRFVRKESLWRKMNIYKA